MKLYSTNNHSNVVDLKEAVLNAFPIDRGLYMPMVVEVLPKSFFRDLHSLAFPEVAYHVARNLIKDFIPKKDLKNIVENSVNFPAPLVRLSENISVLELFHGPTLAFKDFGARFMAQLMSYFLRNENRETTILVATSGDTGGAVAAGFYNVPGIKVVILYPKGKVSYLQEKQLTSWGGNIRAFEINGTFDDCQRMVKEAFLDIDLKNQYKFSSANSINIARLIPQSFYYFEAIKQLEKNQSPVIAVPSGNFGNLTAGLLAKRMGLPIRKFLAATNVNDAVPKYLASGEYKAKPSVSTISNAMDVGDPSNFARMLHLYGSTWNLMKNDIVGYSYSDAQTKKSMLEIYRNHKYISDPHGAVAYQSCKDYLEKHQKSQCIFLETAHPAKFIDVVPKKVNTTLIIPPNLSAFENKVKLSTSCSSDYVDFKQLMISS